MLSCCVYQPIILRFPVAYTLTIDMIPRALRGMIVEFLFFICIAAICFSGLLFTLWDLASGTWTVGETAWLMIQIWFGWSSFFFYLPLDRLMFICRQHMVILWTSLLFPCGVRASSLLLYMAIVPSNPGVRARLSWCFTRPCRTHFSLPVSSSYIYLVTETLQGL